VGDTLPLIPRQIKNVPPGKSVPLTGAGHSFPAVGDTLPLIPRQIKNVPPGKSVPLTGAGHSFPAVGDTLPLIPRQIKNVPPGKSVPLTAFKRERGPIGPLSLFRDSGGGAYESLRPPSAAHFSSMSVVTDFGRSIAYPSARSQVMLQRTPSARPTPKSTV